MLTGNDGKQDAGNDDERKDERHQILDPVRKFIRETDTHPKKLRGACQEPRRFRGKIEGEQNFGAGAGLTESLQCIIMRSVNALLIPAPKNLNLVRSRGAPG